MEWTEKMDEVEVEVSLPRFKMEEKYDLNDVLISMGMVDAFNVGMSDFSGETCYKLMLNNNFLWSRRDD